MRFRKLRIAFSAACGITCLLLIALWVRSYWWMDSLLVRMSQSRVATVASIDGGLLIRFQSNDFSAGWFQRSRPLTGPGIAISPIRFGSEFRSIDSGIEIPHWSVVMSAGLLTILPWLPARFSLRTLLIGTTFVAVVLGLIAAFAQ